MCAESRSRARSFLGGLLELSLAVGEANVEFFCALYNLLTLGSGDALSNLAAVRLVVHEQQFNVFGRTQQELTEAAGEHVARLVVLLASNLRAFHRSAEAATLGAINTSRLTPVSLNTRKIKYACQLLVWSLTRPHS